MNTYTSKGSDRSRQGEDRVLSELKDSRVERDLDGEASGTLVTSKLAYT